MARSCVISEGKEPVALISIDSCGIVKSTRDIIAKRINEFTGIK